MVRPDRRPAELVREEHLNAREVDTLALNEPLPEYEFDQRVNR